MIDSIDVTSPAFSADAAVPLSEQGPASARVVASYGFWLFLLSDIIIFSALFAAYAVLSGHTDNGPNGAQLFDHRNVLIETSCLLTSSFTCGLMMIALDRRSSANVYFCAVLTALLGAAFLGLEVSEFRAMLIGGAGPTRSAFLSSFFALVGAHGLHVTIGLAWLLIMTAQVATLGFRPMVLTRMLCFSLFWHALDIVWIGVFSIVYLGVPR